MYTYKWANTGQTSLTRTTADGGIDFIPATPDNSDYAEFLLSGVTAAPYVAPPEPEPESEGAVMPTGRNAKAKK